jgi:hypothetical protein
MWQYNTHENKMRNSSSLYDFVVLVSRITSSKIKTAMEFMIPT